MIETNAEVELKQESYFIKINEVDTLHLKRIYHNPNGEVAFMLHGSIENGRIFYSNSGKGLAPYLAKKGFDVYIADLRGRGQSTPKISKHSAFGQTSTIVEDIPAFLNKIVELRGNTTQHWLAHSWGGVLLSSYFARFETHRELVKSMVFFGTKRQITVFNWEKLIKIDFFWNIFSRIMIKKYGYLPAEKFKMGSDSETKKSYYQTAHWVRMNPWIDPEDNFDYGGSIKALEVPPLLSITGSADYSLGHPIDAFNFSCEYSNKKATFKEIGKKTGHLNDYDHINLLTHPSATKDHFELVLAWLNA